MSRRSPPVIALAAIFLLTCLPAAALAGVEPVPWRILIDNRSDEPFTSITTIFRIQMEDSSVYDLTISIPDVSPGGSVSFDVIDSMIPKGAQQVLSWRLIARAGVEPSPWRFVYAFPPGAAPTEKPISVPILSLADYTLLTPEFPLLSFASPGVLVGGTVLVSSKVNDLYFTECPTSAGWENHGQYIRCVAHGAEQLVEAGALTQEEADSVVSIAAQSNVGKK